VTCPLGPARFKSLFLVSGFEKGKDKNVLERQRLRKIEITFKACDALSADKPLCGHRILYVRCLHVPWNYRVWDTHARKCRGPYVRMS